MSRKNFSQIVSSRAIMLLIGLLLVSFAGINWARDIALHGHLNASNRANQTLIQLEREIGYGGLIHNLKNAVLRTDEPRYIAAAEQNGLEATALISELRELSTELQFEMDLSNLDVIVDRYSAAVLQTEELIASAMSSTEIDETIRIDDIPALTEITTFQAGLANWSEQQTRQLEQLSLVAMFLMSLVLLIPVLTIYILREYKANEEDLEALESEFETLSFENDNLQNLNSNLKHTNSALRQFAGIVSHDLKAPARQVHMYTDIALRRISDQAVVEETLLEIRGLSKQMEHIISRLLEFTKATFREPKLELIDLQTITEQCAEDVKALHTDDVSIQISTLPSLFVDPELMKHVIRNLFQNAIKYMPEGRKPEITVSAYEKADEQVIQIADNGNGIPKKYAEVIFEPLRRLSAAPGSKSTEGDGLGLAIVRTIVEAHGGRVWLDHTSARTGCTFKISFPRALAIGDDLMTA